ncbi:MAG: ribosomal-processing cysteine protease Prp [Bacilli bacterium]|nr:ribosomal-processing cysteine protease Prp [Bacilli bacterium]MBR6137487.1 ribosomal-processing cysteine protease Prp [Bacilli bacterium]
MITVNVEKENKKYKKISILGHAMYADRGKDIVCSSVSSIVITTVNGILTLNKGSLSYMVGKKGMKIELKSEDETTQLLIHNMVNLLKDLEKQYPENVEVK